MTQRRTTNTQSMGDVVVNFFDLKSALEIQPYTMPNGTFKVTNMWFKVHVARSDYDWLEAS